MEPSNGKRRDRTNGLCRHLLAETVQGTAFQNDVETVDHFHFVAREAAGEDLAGFCVVFVVSFR